MNASVPESPLESKLARPEFVIETRGGAVVCTYSDDPTIQVTLGDWDEFEDGSVAVDYPVDSLSCMPSETAEALARARRSS